MIFLDEIKPMVLYKKPFHLPIVNTDKRKGSTIFLLTPNYKSSINLLNNSLLINKNYFYSYFIEKDITYYITKEGYLDSERNGFVVTEGKDFKTKGKKSINISNLDKNYKSKETYKLSKFKRVKLTQNIINKYKNVNDTIKYLKTGKNYTGYIFLDKKDKLVGFVNINTDTNTILALEVNEEYRNHKLSKQILDFVIKELKADNLAVNKNNAIAIKLYEKYNFNIYAEDDLVYYMKLPKSRISEVSNFMGCPIVNEIYDSGYIRCKNSDDDIMFIFNNALEEKFIQESGINYNSILKRILFRERFKSNKEVFEIYDKVKNDVKYIKKTFIDIDKYKSLNLFVDLSFYNQTFFKNNIYKSDKAIEIYGEFLDRLINDPRFEKNGYTKKTVMIPTNVWGENKDSNIYNYKDNINPVSMIIRMIRNLKISKLQKFKDIDFLFINNYGYFKINLADLEMKNISRFVNLIEKLNANQIENIDDPNKESKQAITANILDKLEDSQNIKIYNLTGKGEDNINKKELVDKINQAAATSNTTDDALEKLGDNPNENEHIKELIDKLASEEDESVKISVARAARMDTLQKNFLEKKVNNKTVKELLDDSKKDKELPTTKLELDTINDEWKDLKYINFEKVYDIEEDILSILNSLSTKTSPVAVRDIKKENISTSEDYIDKYTVQFEDINGERFTIRFDLPRFINRNKMMLRGNEKIMNSQLTLMPIIKTDKDTVQVVSNYKKIFIRRYGSAAGKSYVTADFIMKTLAKYDKTDIKVTFGDNTKICNKYQLPIDYIDLASQYSKIENKEYIFYFNQDEIRSLYNVDESKGIPFAYLKSKKEIMYFNSYQNMISDEILYKLEVGNDDFKTIFNSLRPATKYSYSQASILNRKIPLIVIMAYNEGLEKAMKKANISYHIGENRTKANHTVDVIKFKDAYLTYYLDYNSSLLMNGLKECNTEDYSIVEMNSKAMYLDFLDLFGGRLTADGLDNFYDLMIDPITYEVLKRYNLPTDYIEVLAYANLLLADNKYIKHTDMSARRYRSNELVAGYFYQAIADSYGDYRTALKKNKKATMTMKQSIVIDKVLLDPTCSDSSDLNDLLDAETGNSVTTKGLAGMNSERSYSLDKRTFDKSMFNILGLSTGFAGNVGVTRQATIDSNIEGKRGYIKITDDPNKASSTKTFTITEALTPFGTTRDDPFRSAMTFIQTSKHAMRVKNATPLLISNGADQALPYLTSDTFSFNAKDDGKVIEVTEEYIILEYKNGQHDFVDLRNSVKKNSNGGFYTPIKLDSDYKVGQKFKVNDIIAYDKLSYSDKVGHTNNLAYNLGTLCKIAILNTDEGYEDSAIIAEWLSEAMASDVVIKKDVILPKNTNIYNMVTKGQAIQEGDPLLIFQNAFSEDDVNLLLKNLVDDEELISDLGRIPIKSKVTGFVEDIRIYRTVEKDELSDSLKKKVNELEKPTDKLLKVMNKYNIDSSYKLESNYKLESSGKLKNVEDGVLIEFYLKYEDKMSIGDKLIFYSALKGVIKDIFPEGLEPYTDFRPGETVDGFVSLGSVMNRMVGSININGGINKVLIELDRTIKTKAGLKFKYLNEM